MSDASSRMTTSAGGRRADLAAPLPDVTRSSREAAARAVASAADGAVPCERCGTAMFRMHAVWRCPGCGFKTDCCGW